MITCKFIDKLYYKYDGQNFDDNEKCKICYVLYRNNELGKYPFMEFTFEYINESEIIHNNNLNNIISFFKNKDNRYSGFHKKGDILFLFFSTNFLLHKYNSLDWWNLNDILNGKNFNKTIENDIAQFFIENKEHFVLQNIITKQFYEIPNIVYNRINISREQTYYLNNYYTLYGIEKHDIILNVNQINDPDGELIKHILFSREITNYKDIISIIEKK